VSDAPLFSDAWLDDCNEALATLAPTREPDARALVVTERILDAPPGVHHEVTIVCDADGVRLEGGERPDATAWLTVSMDAAVALHDGSLEPSAALAQGRVRVRGDLRGVVEAVGLLAVAHGALRQGRGTSGQTPSPPQ
jgi:SCP-2 sterol transfer family protein